MLTDTCPLLPDWAERLRPVHFSPLPGEAALRLAHRAHLVKSIASLEPEWHVAPDDRSRAPGSAYANFTRGFPCHIHTTFKVEGQQVHIDHTWANFFGPGRLKEEWYIHVDGRLAGFGGLVGCSLGFTLAITPAVALLGNGQAIVVRRQSNQGITLEQVLADPGNIELYATSQAGLAAAG